MEKKYLENIIIEIFDNLFENYIIFLWVKNIIIILISLANNETSLIYWTHKQHGAEAPYNLMIDTINDMPSDLNQTTKSLMVRRKKQLNKQQQFWRS